MAGDFLGGLSREFVEMIDERLNKPLSEWTPGTWFFALMVAGTGGFFLSLIWIYLIRPSWDAAVWINDGKALQALHALSVSAIFKTVLFLSVLIFLIGVGTATVSGAIGIALWIRGHEGGLRKHLFEKIAELEPFAQVTFWMMMLCLVMIMGAVW
ncbi:MAG: hypothetical protein ABSC92_02490 [Rhizomicrobium sp.]|jgi:hypothetical protein